MKKKILFMLMCLCCVFLSNAQYDEHINVSTGIYAYPGGYDPVWSLHVLEYSTNEITGNTDITDYNGSGYVAVIPPGGTYGTGAANNYVFGVPVNGTGASWLSLSGNDGWQGTTPPLIHGEFIYERVFEVPIGTGELNTNPRTEYEPNFVFMLSDEDVNTVLAFELISPVTSTSYDLNSNDNQFPHPIVISNPEAGDWKIRVKFNSQKLFMGFVFSGTINLIPASCSAFISGGNAVCNNDLYGSTGTLSLSGMGIYDPGTSILWNTGETTTDINITQPGTYSVVVADLYGCTATANYVVNNQLPPINPPTASGVTICEGNSAILHATGSPSGMLAWFSTPTGDTYLGAGGTFTTPILTATTTYYVADYLCIPSSTRTPVMVTVNPITHSDVYYSGCNSYTLAGTIYTASTTFTTTAVNAAGCNNIVTTHITIYQGIPARPSTIIASQPKACENDILSYSVSSDVNVVTYNWVVPATASILTGAGTNAITVKFNTGFTGGTVSVSATNSCGTSTSSSKYVPMGSLPLPPASVTGTTNVCPDIFAGTDVVYSCTPVANNTGYLWTLSDPVNSHIVSHSGTGANDLSITVHFDNAFTAGYIYVKSITNCGTSLNKRSLFVRKKRPFTPIISGNTTPCHNGIETFTASVTQANSYNWIISSSVATIIGGQGTPNVTVQFKPAFSTGAIKVMATNSVCGNSSIGSLLTTVSTTCRVAEKQNNPAEKPEPEMGMKIFPNPASRDFTVSINFNDKIKNANIEITNAFGQSVYKKNVPNNNGTAILKINDYLPAGVYMVTCVTGFEKITNRLVISK